MQVLETYLPQAAHVLDAGGGPGRYTIALAQQGHRVHLVDLSQTQLDMARARIADANVADRVVSLSQADICDLSEFPSGTFDAVLCLGGALSYVRERRGDAIRELIRVAQPGAPLIVSVMSMAGALHLIGTLDACSFLESIEDHIDWDPTSPLPSMLDSVPDSREWHAPMTLYTSSFLRRTLEEQGCRVLHIAATNSITAGDCEMPRIAASQKAIDVLVRLEQELCSLPGVLDMGQHLIAVATTPS